MATRATEIQISSSSAPSSMTGPVQPGLDQVTHAQKSSTGTVTADQKP